MGLGRTRARTDFSIWRVKGLEDEVTHACSPGPDPLRGISNCGSRVGEPLRDLGLVWLSTRLTSGAGV